MLSQNLMWEGMPLGGIHARECSSGTWRPQELLIGKPLQGSTALDGLSGPQELLIGKDVSGSNSSGM
jgi:hypothetical protein